MKDASSIILSYNKGLPQEGQIEKYKAIQENTLRFYRGTCHLFYDRLVSIGAPKDKTKAWICGDLHLENLGSFKADNRLVYFDINDFDEAALAPLSWEVLRFVTAIQVSGDSLGYSQKDAATIAKAALKKYTAAMIRSKALIMQRETATGVMLQFFDQVAKRKREEFIDRVTINKGKKKAIGIDNVRIRQLDKDTHKRIMEWLPTGLASIQKLKDLTVEDCQHRIAGTGSLGVDRYAILAKQKGTGKYYLLDMKESKPSSLVKHLHIEQPEWDNESQRIITIQNRMQFYSPALLSSVYFDKKHFVVKELQPVQDKMNFSAYTGKVNKMQDVILSMANIAAYTHLRSTGRQGSSTADELGELVSKPKWSKHIYELSRELSAQMAEDFKDFRKYEIPKLSNKA